MTPRSASLRYVPFATLMGDHPYFEQGICRQIKFLPTPQTADFLKTWDVLAREDGTRLDLFGEAEALGGVWKDLKAGIEPRALVFLAGSLDPRCGTYTDLPEAAALPCCIAEPEGAWRQGRLDEVDAEIEALPRRPSPGAWSSLAWVVLPLNGTGAQDEAAWRASLGGTWRLPIPGREAIWKYLLLGDWGDRALRVVDLADRMGFEEPQEEVLPDGRTAIAIRSQGPLLLEEVSAHRFQLKDVASVPERVLIRRLPSAVPGRFHRDRSRGDPSLISEIFVNR